ncbi:hypothetical protein CEP54_012118 [Fusarium duplospermum]|uniref:Thioester reductase (TE) domain-containing protein n=1 Tax=Fusarium duplospermum TaxID=1325734 RepID=A0A428PAS3_9HYPO|nr:hypothetical protein CEP54_012118 [Fusarium duplospermum]
MSGIVGALYSALMFDWTIVLPPPGPISMSLVESLLDSFPMNSAFIPPSILNEMAKSTDALNKLVALDLVISAGGPVAPFAGDIISRHTNLQQIMGSTEGQWYATLPTKRSDWAYFQFSSETGYEMVPDRDGLHELVFKRQPHLDLTQPIFVTFPKLNVWHTQDLYLAHPETPGLWKFEGRKDDLLILSNGMKIKPLAAEAQLSKQPAIQAACLAGSGKFQVAALIQLANGFSKHDKATLNMVWEAIEECNTSMSSYAQIHRQFVRIVDEPFVWTPKGTLSRKATYRKFSQEINSLYQEQSSGPQVSTSDFDRLHATILQAARGAIGNTSLAGEGDLFQAGFDSLSVQLLHRSIEASGQPAQLKTIYDHPSVDKMSQALWQSLQPQNENSTRVVDDVRALLAKYTPNLQPEPKGTRVILTGSTGFLGSYLLDALVADKEVSEVWCLNRSQDAPQKQVQSAKDKGLRHDWGSKVKFFTAQLGLPDCGLEAGDYRTLLRGATHVIHNAWQVNFNLSIWSFENQIAGVSNLIQFCSEAKTSVHVCYISSIGVATNWSATHVGPVPEALVQDTAAPGTGYGASKMVAENLLYQAANADVLRLTVCRVGQMSGPVLRGPDHGVWNPKEWLPTLIRSSSEMRALPEDLGNQDIIDWVPIDLAAHIIQQMIFNSDTSNGLGPQFFHAINPNTIRWFESYGTPLEI